MRLASRFGYANQIRRDRPLTHEELMHYVPGIFGKINTRPEARTIRTSPPSPYWKACSGKAFSHSSPARPVCATRAAGDTQTHAASAAGRRDKRRTCP